MLSKDEYSMGIPYLHSSMRQRDLSRESMNKISNCSLYLMILSWTQVNSLCLSAFLPREVAVLWGSIFDSSEHVPNFVRRISTTKYFPLRANIWMLLVFKPVLTYHGSCMILALGVEPTCILKPKSPY